MVWQLGAWFSVRHYIGFNKSGSTLVLKNNQPLTGNIKGKINHPDAFCIVKKTRSVQIMGSLQDEEDTEVPGLIFNNVGRGKVIYFAGHPETSIYMTEFNVNDNLPRGEDSLPRDQKMADLFCSLVTNTTVANITVDNLPPGVVVETYNHEYKGAKGIEVHLLNLTGMVSGGIGEMNQITFPDIKKQLPDQNGQIQITVRAKDIRNAFMLSPDFYGLYELPFEKKNDEIICRLSTFARFSIIYFNQCEVGALNKIAKVPVRSGQPEFYIIETNKTLSMAKIMASGDKVSASSKYDGSSDAFKAHDGIYQRDDSLNFWGSDDKRDINSWWMIEFKNEKQVNMVRVQYRNIGGVFRFVPLSVTVQISRDSTNWTSVVTKSTNVPKDDTDYSDKMYEYKVGQTTKSVRLIFEDGGSSFFGYKIVELVEVEVK